MDKPNIPTMDNVSELIAGGRYAAANDAHKIVMGDAKVSALDKLLAERQAQGRMAGTPPLQSAAKEATSLLPKGISGGKVAAYVAAASVLAGGVYLMTRKKPEREAAWTDKIGAERASGRNNVHTP